MLVDLLAQKLLSFPPILRVVVFQYDLDPKHFRGESYRLCDDCRGFAFGQVRPSFRHVYNLTVYRDEFFCPGELKQQIALCLFPVLSAFVCNGLDDRTVKRSPLSGARAFLVRADYHFDHLIVRVERVEPSEPLPDARHKVGPARIKNVELRSQSNHAAQRTLRKMATPQTNSASRKSSRSRILFRR